MRVRAHQRSEREMQQLYLLLWSKQKKSLGALIPSQFHNLLPTYHGKN
jgi:hypothetical protein